MTIIIFVLLIKNLAEPLTYTNFTNSIINEYTLNLEIILTWILAIIIIIVPASVTIRKVLYKYEPNTITKEEFGHPGAGALVGILERIIILLMLALNQYAAIGFVLTAKSIARYNKIVEDPQFSEYYLLGTLASMLIVIVTYLTII